MRIRLSAKEHLTCQGQVFTLEVGDNKRFASRSLEGSKGNIAQWRCKLEIRKWNKKRMGPWDLLGTQPVFICRGRRAHDMAHSGDYALEAGGNHGTDPIGPVDSLACHCGVGRRNKSVSSVIAWSGRKPRADPTRLSQRSCYGRRRAATVSNSETKPVARRQAVLCPGVAIAC